MVVEPVGLVLRHAPVTPHTTVRPGVPCCAPGPGGHWSLRRVEAASQLFLTRRPAKKNWIKEWCTNYYSLVHAYKDCQAKQVVWETRSLLHMSQRTYFKTNLPGDAWTQNGPLATTPARSRATLSISSGAGGDPSLKIRKKWAMYYYSTALVWVVILCMLFFYRNWKCK